jgi:hypothetical protein
MFSVEQEAYALVNINGGRPSRNPTASHYAMALPTLVLSVTLLTCDLRGMLEWHTEFYSNSVFSESRTDLHDYLISPKSEGSFFFQIRLIIKNCRLIFEFIRINTKRMNMTSPNC